MDEAKRDPKEFTLSKRIHMAVARDPKVAEQEIIDWFGGVYKDPNDFNNFFPRIAIDPE